MNKIFQFWHTLFFLFTLYTGGFAQDISLSVDADTLYTLSIHDLPLGEQVKSSGLRLINQPIGFTRIVSEGTKSTSEIIVAIHGYGSKGYEWIYPLNQMVQYYSNVYFYRFDWNLCPDKAAELFVRDLDFLFQLRPSTNKLIIFSHSFGGLVATFAASLLPITIATEIHTIASPLAGYPGLTDRCEMLKSDEFLSNYAPWDEKIQHIQWRTQHHQDNAFNKLPVDPQVVYLRGSEVIQLPATMDNHRLGHNWSISWVTDEYLKSRNRLPVNMR